MMQIKPLLIFTLGLLNLPAFFAQGLLFDTGILDGHHHRYPQIAVHDGNIYSADQREYGTFTTTSFVTARDSMGNQLWEVSLTPLGDYMDIQSLTTDNYGNIFLIVSSRLGCSFGNCASYLIKLDAQGNELWSKYWNNINCSPSNIVDFRVAENQTISIVMNSFGSSAAIIELDQDGIELNNTFFNVDSLQLHTRLSNGNYIGVNGNNVFLFSSIGVTLGNFTTGSTIVDIVTKNDSLYVLSSESAYLLSEQLLPLQEVTLPAYDHFISWNSSNTALHAVHEEPNSFSIVTFDPNLVPLDTLLIPSIHTALFDFAMDTSLFVAIEETNLYQNQQLRLRNYSLNNPIGLSTNYSDVGISDVVITNTQIALTPQPNVYYVQVSANVQLNNFGNTTVQSCKILHVYNGMPYACGQNGYSMNLTNLNLAPGDSMTVPLSLLHAQNELIYGNPLQTQICVFSANPNGQTDANVSNDHSCQSANFGYLNGLAIENELFAIYPNPSEDWVTVDFIGHESNIIVFDLLGRPVMREKLDPSQKRFSVASLPRGSYTVLLSSKYGTEYRTLMKQ
jgi:hypothetical protein